MVGVGVALGGGGGRGGEVALEMVGFSSRGSINKPTPTATTSLPSKIFLIVTLEYFSAPVCRKLLPYMSGMGPHIPRYENFCSDICQAF